MIWRPSSLRTAAGRPPALACGRGAALSASPPAAAMACLGPTRRRPVTKRPPPLLTSSQVPDLERRGIAASAGGVGEQGSSSRSSAIRANVLDVGCFGFFQRSPLPRPSHLAGAALLESFPAIRGAPSHPTPDFSGWGGAFQSRLPRPRIDGASPTSMLMLVVEDCAATGRKEEEEVARGRPAAATPHRRA